MVYGFPDWLFRWDRNLLSNARCYPCIGFGQVVDSNLEPEWVRPLEQWYGIHDKFDRRVQPLVQFREIRSLILENC